METLDRQMPTKFHQSHDVDEDGEVLCLGRSQWVCFEEGDYAPAKISARADPKPIHILPVVVTPAISADGPAPEEPLQIMQYLHAPSSLRDRELGLDLPTESTRSVAEDRNTEAAFAIDKADDPLRNYWPFLLIVRTGRIVTTHIAAPYKQGVTTIAVAPDTRVFQHIASCTVQDHS